MLSMHQLDLALAQLRRRRIACMCLGRQDTSSHLSMVAGAFLYSFVKKALAGGNKSKEQKA